MRENELLTQLVGLYQQKNESRFEALFEKETQQADCLKNIQKELSSLSEQLGSLQELESDVTSLSEKQKEIRQLYVGLHAKYIFLLEKKETVQQAPVAPIVPEVPVVHMKPKRTCILPWFKKA